MKSPNRVVKKMLLANGTLACAALTMFVIFVVFRVLSGKDFSVRLSFLLQSPQTPEGFLKGFLKGF